MADVLGEAAVVLTVMGEGGLAAELAAVNAQLEQIEQQANESRAAASGLAQTNAPASVGVTSNASAMAGRTGPGVRPGQPHDLTSTPAVTLTPISPAGENGDPTRQPRSRADGSASAGPGGPVAAQSRPATGPPMRGNLVTIANRPLIVRLDGPIAIRPSSMRAAAAVGSAPGQPGPHGVPVPSAASVMGGPAAAAGGNVAKMMESVDALGNAFTRTFAVGTTSILGLVAAASPSSFATLQGSVKSVAIEVGATFVPFVDQASAGLQRFAGWFGSLDDATKSTVGKIVMTTVAVAGLGSAAKLCGLNFGRLASAVFGVGQKLALTVGVGAPWIGAIGGAIAVVGGLAAAWWGVGKAVDAAGAGMSRAGGMGGVGGGPGGEERKTVQQMMELVPEQARERLNAASGDKKKFQSAIDEEIKAAELEAIEEKQKSPKIIKHENEEALKRYNLMSAEHGLFQKFYDEQLASYRKEVNPAAVEIPKERVLGDGTARVRQYTAVIEEFERIRRNILREDPTIRPGDMAAFGAVVNPKRPASLARPSEFAKPIPRIVNDDRITESELRLKNLRELKERTGSESDMKRDLKLPFQSRYTTFDSYGESLQIKLLEGNELSTANEIAQLRKLIETVAPGSLLRELVEIRGEIKKLTNTFRQ